MFIIRGKRKEQGSRFKGFDVMTGKFVRTSTNATKFYTVAETLAEIQKLVDTNQSLVFEVFQLISNEKEKTNESNTAA